MDIPTYAAPDYFIIYNSSHTKKNLGALSFYDAMDLKNTKHFFDSELDPVLEIINYLLHFPRYNFDFSELAPRDIKMINNIAQNILFLPNFLFGELVEKNFIKDKKRSIFIIADEIYDEISSHDKLIDKTCYSFTTLKQMDLKKIWKDLNHYNNGVNDIIEYQSLSKSEILPLLHFSDQIDKVEKKIFELDASSIVDIADYRLKQQGYLEGMQVLCEMSEEERKNLSPDKKKLIFEEALNSATFPVTLTLPGQPRRIDKWTSDRELPLSEKKALKLIGIHNAIANNGIHIALDTISSECFSELDNLENHCKENHSKGNINNKYVWRILKKLGKLLARQLGSDVTSILRRASRIKVFSDFPIGLAILPDTDAPLCCHKSITYMPITPLTRALQLEMGMKAPILLESNIKVLIIECLAEDDNIRKASDHIWATLKKNVDTKFFNVIYEIADSPQEFQSIIDKHADVKILIISAHGAYDEKTGYTAIKIGRNNYWSPVGNKFNSPPIVFFSACHVSPRGRGAISIADLFIRSGAQVVLGTLIPIEVGRNGLLMMRLLLYISETLKGEYDYKNLAEVWKFTVSSNAVNEIVESTKALKEWSLTPRKDYSFPMKDFQHRDSINKLRYTHVYTDTIKVLREIAEKDGVLNKLDNALSNDCNFPESVFYQLIGSPENVLLNPFHKKL